MGSNDPVGNECEDPVRNECEVVYEVFHILNCGCEIITARIIAYLISHPQFNI